MPTNADEPCALVFLAEGFEEIEALTSVDLLRRAGIKVVTVSITDERVVEGAHGIAVCADAVLPISATYNAVILPGGMPGASNLAASSEVGAILHSAQKNGLLIGAICAAPAVVLAPLRLLSGKRFTCYPGMEAQVQGADYRTDAVVVDGNIITSRGVGTAAAFALALIEKLCGKAKAEEVGKKALVLWGRVL